jgi:hypothetical protein
LILNLSSPSAKEVAGLLLPKENLYVFHSFPELRISVKKSLIKDQTGNVVNIIG